MNFDKFFQSTIDAWNRTKEALQRLLPKKTKHPGSKRDKRLVKAKRRRQNKAARLARRHNRRPTKRPKGRRKP